LVLGIVIVSVLALVLTLSRGGYLGLAATAVVLIILGGRRIFTRRNIIPMVGIVAVVAVGLVTFLNFSGRFSLDVFWKQATEYQQGVSVEERYSAYDQAVKLFAEHPVIGVGVGNFGPRVAKYAQVMPKDGWAIVNNESLELLAETGIFGFAAIAGLMVLVVGRAGCVLWRARQTEVTNADIRFLAAVLGGLLAALVGILVQYQTFSTLYILHVWFVVGMMEAVGSTMRNLIPK
jgi:O-antigen ligase